VGNVAAFEPTADRPREEPMALWKRQDERQDPQGGDLMGISKRDDAAQGTGPSGDLLLGAGAEFDGKLTFAGTVRIDARFKGTIVTDDVLVVGDRARIDADITCGTVVVYGEVNGNVKARIAVELHASAKLRGDVETPAFSMEKGAVFQGQSTMPVTSAAAAARPSVAAAVRNGAEARSAATTPAP
jgi:cytoskeletal protein CcmA (bactofilin family)